MAHSPYYMLHTRTVRNLSVYVHAEMRLTYVLLVLFVTARCSPQGRCPASDEQYDADVLILGAGMAGIAAAKALYEGGASNFLILEAKDRIGGRMHSKEFGGIRVELGAQTIAGVDDDNTGKYEMNPLWKEAKRCGLKGQMADVSSRVFYEGSNRINDSLYISIGIQSFLAFGNAAAYSKTRQAYGRPDVSVRHALAKFGWKPDTPPKMFIDWSLVDMGFGQPPEKVSLFNTIPFKTSDKFGDDIFFISDQRGSEHLLRCIGKDFNLVENDPRVLLNTYVSNIQYGDQCVCVTAVQRNGQNRNYCAKYAISTFSIGLLQSNRLKFNPPLPQWKQDAINTFEMVHLLKIFVKFNYTFWDRVMFIDRADKIRGRYPVIQPLCHFDTIPDDSNVLQFYLTGKKADFIVTQPLEVAKREVVEILHEVYPNAYIPEPEDILLSTWKIDPLNQGTYSNKPIGLDVATFKNLARPVGQLYFSGEATQPDYSGLLHGAYIAGRDVGKAIAAELNYYY